MNGKVPFITKVMFDETEQWVSIILDNCSLSIPVSQAKEVTNLLNGLFARQYRRDSKIEVSSA